jgi:hypothetical protein
MRACLVGPWGAGALVLLALLLLSRRRRRCEEPLKKLM